MTGGPEETLRQRHGGQGTDTQAGFVPAQLGTRYLHKISSQDIYRRSTAKSKCCCSIWQRKGPGTKSISVIAKVAWYKINFSSLQLY